MRYSTLFGTLAGAALVVASPVSDVVKKDGKYTNITTYPEAKDEQEKISPKVFIISMFSPEADIWYDNAATEGSIGNLLEKNITIPGLSMLFPDAHCLADGSVCQLTTGESEINAATTISSLMLSPYFDLTKTYFLIAGIAGINPKYGTTADVALSKYAVQVALQYEFDAREMPENWTTGYFPQGSYAPGEYPESIYGTEVFEVNEALRDIAVQFASTAVLNDSATAIKYRANYNSSELYAAATHAPSVITCDVATSDVYFSGTLLGEAFENFTTLMTNGSATYCMTAQEDNATLEAMLRAAINGLVDFGRIMIMRTASDFDRPYVGDSVEDNLLYNDVGGYTPSVQNIYLAGTPIVKGILDGWNSTFAAGVNATNYIGDIFGTLGGEPDFGPGSSYDGEGVVLSQVGISRRDAYKKVMRR